MTPGSELQFIFVIVIISVYITFKNQRLQQYWFWMNADLMSYNKNWAFVKFHLLHQDLILFTHWKSLLLLLFDLVSALSHVL